MEPVSYPSRIRTWVGRFAWSAIGALLVLTGLWILPPCVTNRIELINTENMPTDVTLSLVSGFGEKTLWRGRLGNHRVQDLAFDLGSTDAHFRLTGRFVGSDISWDREFGYVSSDYDQKTEVVLVGADKITTKWRSDLKECAREDTWCAISEIAVLAPRVSRCLIKGREAWWR
jgi:hypothetical protein